ncbi:MAG TPA: hypothetical protein PL009_08340 [Flavipsychrobacter sp.]|nr:hypothetical protein [Flavipsychrobacter sp.]
MKQLKSLLIVILFVAACKTVVDKPDFSKPVVLENTPAPIVPGGWRKMGDFFNINAENVHFAFTLKNKAYFQVDMIYQELLSDFWEYDPSTNKFTAKAKLPGREDKEDRNDRCFSIAVGDKGFFGLGNYWRGGLNQIWEYDPDFNTWTRKADFPRRNTNRPGTFTLNGKIYFWGWQEYDGYRTDSLFEYDLITDRWTDRTVHYPGYSKGLSELVVAVDGKAYAWGLDYAANTYRLFQYDPVMNIITNLSEPQLQFAAQVFYVFGSDLYLYCGAKNLNSFVYTNEIWKYSTINKTWEKQKDFDGPIRSNAFGFTIGSKAYICFGRNGGTEYNDIWEHNP